MLHRGRRFVAFLVAAGLLLSAGEGAFANTSPPNVSQASTASAPEAPTEELPSHDSDCPPGCACSCTCACPGPGAILPTVSPSRIDDVKVGDTERALEAMPVIAAPEPRLRPPLL